MSNMMLTLISMNDSTNLTIMYKTSTRTLFSLLGSISALSNNTLTMLRFSNLTAECKGVSPNWKKKFTWSKTQQKVKQNDVIQMIRVQKIKFPNNYRS